MIKIPRNKNVKVQNGKFKVIESFSEFYKKNKTIIKKIRTLVKGIKQ